MNTTDIQVFENVDFGKVRIIEMDGEPWFVGKDVAKILGYNNHRDALARHVDNEDKKDGVVIHDSIGREQKPMLINESGLYSLILSSKLEKAKEFKHWVTSEVIPSIRKKGKYIAPNAAQNVPDMGKLSLTTQCLINLELQSNELRKDLDGALKRIEELERSKPTAAQEPEPEPQKTEPKKWSEREKDYLRRAYALGQTDVEIAADLGRTLDSVKNQRQKLGLTCKKIARWTKAEDKKLKLLRNKGLACADISVIIGRSYDGIHNRLCLLRRKGVKI